MAQYDKIAKFYDDLMGDIGDTPHTFLIDPLMSSFLPIKKDLSVLDLGCGNGYWTKLLGQKYQKVIGIDNSKELIKIAKNKRQLPNIEYKLIDIEDELPFADNSFDFMFSNMVIHYVKDLNKLIHELYRIVKPDGLILLSFVHPAFESNKNPSLKQCKKRTSYKTSTLGGLSELTLQFQPLDLIIKDFLSADFKLIGQKDAIITSDLVEKYPRYQEYIGLPRAAILIFRK